MTSSQGNDLDILADSKLQVTVVDETKSTSRQEHAMPISLVD